MSAGERACFDYRRIPVALLLPVSFSEILHIWQINSDCTLVVVLCYTVFLQTRPPLCTAGGGSQFESMEAVRLFMQLSISS